MKFSGFVYYVVDYPTEHYNMFKIELENRDFRKSLYFYIVDAEKKTKKRAASGSWKNMGCGRLPAP